MAQSVWTIDQNAQRGSGIRNLIDVFWARGTFDLMAPPLDVVNWKSNGLSDALYIYLLLSNDKIIIHVIANGWSDWVRSTRDPPSIGSIRTITTLQNKILIIQTEQLLCYM